MERQEAATQRSRSSTIQRTLQESRSLDTRDQTDAQRPAKRRSSAFMMSELVQSEAQQVATMDYNLSSDSEPEEEEPPMVEEAPPVVAEEATAPGPSATPLSAGTSDFAKLSAQVKVESVTTDMLPEMTRKLKEVCVCVTSSLVGLDIYIFL